MGWEKEGFFQLLHLQVMKLSVEGLRDEKMTKNDSLQWEITQQSHGPVIYTETRKILACWKIFTWSSSIHMAGVSSERASTARWMGRLHCLKVIWRQGRAGGEHAMAGQVKGRSCFEVLHGFHLSRVLAEVMRGATAGWRLTWRCRTAPFPPHATGNDWSITRD